MRAVVMIATGLGLALCDPAEAQEDVTIWGFGMGNRSCAYWLSDTTTENAGEHWIDGYLTGLNAGNRVNPMVGHTVDSAGIYGEIKKLCNEHPSDVLALAAAKVYLMLKEQKR